MCAIRRKKLLTHTSGLSFTLSHFVFGLCIELSKEQSNSRGRRNGVGGGILFLKVSVCFRREFFLALSACLTPEPWNHTHFLTTSSKPHPHCLSPSSQPTALRYFIIMDLFNTILPCLCLCCVLVLKSVIHFFFCVRVPFRFSSLHCFVHISQHFDLPKRILMLERGWHVGMLAANLKFLGNEFLVHVSV